MAKISKFLLYYINSVLMELCEAHVSFADLIQLRVAAICQRLKPMVITRRLVGLLRITIEEKPEEYSYLLECDQHKEASSLFEGDEHKRSPKFV